MCYICIADQFWSILYICKAAYTEVLITVITLAEGGNRMEDNFYQHVPR